MRRFGGAYPSMLILDADSVMEGATIVRLAAMMEREPGTGLIQTLPVIVNGTTLFARMQQFAGRIYGPLIAHGIARWHGTEGNYWATTQSSARAPSPSRRACRSCPDARPSAGTSSA